MDGIRIFYHPFTECGVSINLVGNILVLEDFLYSQIVSDVRGHYYLVIQLRVQAV